MNRKSRISFLSFILLLLLLPFPLLLSVSGCFGSRSHEFLEALEDELGASLVEKQFVEGYLEYAGPPDRWSGFETFILHVRARDRGNAEVVVTPSSFGKKDRTLSTNQPKNQTAEGMPSDTARERFATLAQAFEKSPRMDFSGCFYPVRVRLARRNGEILEMRGCRGQKGWVEEVSKLVDDVLLSQS